MTRIGNPGLDALKPYPFERLREIVSAATSDPATRLNLSIGEPKFATPPFIIETLTRALGQLGQYPTTVGTASLRAACAGWLERRYGLAEGSVDPVQHVLPNLGSREALFAAINALFDRSDRERPLVAMPNPGYQIYEGATLLAGGTPCYLNADPARGFVSTLEGLDADTLAQIQIAVICSPGNPTGATVTLEQWQSLLALAHAHNFLLFADECYSDIYTDAAPIGLLEAARQTGYPDFARCLSFFSLSKRSNAPGLRSGFIAGEARLMSVLRRYRTYHGSAMSLPVQDASEAAWSDDAHVEANRARYRANFAAAESALTRISMEDCQRGAFYLWLPVPGDDVTFCRRLLDEQNVLVLPGSFMGRETAGGNPGAGFVRVALVYDQPISFDALNRINQLL